MIKIEFMEQSSITKFPTAVFFFGFFLSTVETCNHEASGRVTYGTFGTCFAETNLFPWNISLEQGTHSSKLSKKLMKRGSSKTE
jgi:hypothetical protein